MKGAGGVASPFGPFFLEGGVGMEEMMIQPLSSAEFLSRQQLCRQKAGDRGFDGLMVIGGPLLPTVF